MTSDRARELAEQLVVRANVLLQETEPSEEGPDVPPRYSLARVGVEGWITNPAASVYINVALLGSLTASLVLAVGSRPGDWAGYGALVLRIAVAWALAFAPGWMFVRYFNDRVSVLWDRYVLGLYRLDLDRPGNLPRPPLNTPYFARWRADGGERGSWQRNVYQEKFDSYHGRSIARSASDRLRRLRGEALTPVFLLTSLLSVGWTTLLLHLPPVAFNSNDHNWWMSVAFGFAGAYTYVVQVLMRRFVRNDLRNATYTLSAIYICVVCLLAAGLDRSLIGVGVHLATTTAAATMYAFGLFALAAPTGLIRLVALLWRVVISLTVPSIRSQFPLSELDGMTVWYESSLRHQGIEDMEALVAANLVDLLLQTQIPLSRIVDWIDQASLLLHLGGSGDLRHKLRRLGVRTATGLLSAFPIEKWRHDKGKAAARTDSAWDAIDQADLNEATIRELVRTLERDPTLQPVKNWYATAGSSFKDTTEATSSDARGRTEAQGTGARSGKDM